jgi:hypoxanthine phosphoribosyltransferase
MGDIRVHDKQFEPYLNAEEIALRIKMVAQQINQDYAGKKDGTLRYNKPYH